MKDEGKLVKVGNEDELFEHISSLIVDSRKHVAKAVNTAMVYTYYGVGQYIVEFEQNGDYRAAYGKGVLNRLSARLTDRFGKGWSYETLAKCRKFYHIYAILSASQTKSQKKQKLSAAQTNFARELSLSRNHTEILLRLAKAAARQH